MLNLFKNNLNFLLQKNNNKKKFLASAGKKIDKVLHAESFPYLPLIFFKISYFFSESLLANTC